MKAGQRLAGERARRDGRIFAYAFNPLPEGGGVLTFSDVTEARQREARLARSEEGFRYRFRNLPLPVWTYSAKTLKFLDVNDAAIAEYGYTREEFLSMSAIDMCGPDGAERLSKWLAEGGRSSAFEPNEWYNRRKDGRILQVEFYGARHRLRRRAGPSHRRHRCHGSSRMPSGLTSALRRAPRRTWSS